MSCSRVVSLVLLLGGCAVSQEAPDLLSGDDDESMDASDLPDGGEDGPGGGLGPFDWRDGVMYFVLVDRFANGDPSNDAPLPDIESAANYTGGDLAGVTAKIQEGYFTELGINVLWLTAPFDNADGAGIGTDGHYYSAYHGYWPSDLEAVDARIGTRNDLAELVNAAHDVGIRVVLDYVMNHVHEESPVYTEHPDWFWPLGNCVCGGGCSWDDTFQRKKCWFTPYLPDFDFRNDAARAWSVENAVAWAMEAGVDGFRLDAVKHIETQWVRDLRSRLTAERLGGESRFYLVGETFTGDAGLIREYVDPQTMLDGQFDFPLRAAIVERVLMRKGNMQNLVDFLDANEGYYGDGAIMGTFLGNHDLPRTIHLAEDSAQFGAWDGGRDRAWFEQPQLPGYRAPFERTALGYVLLYTLPGIPLLYYGDELGMPGAGDPDNRRPMQWSEPNPDQAWLRDRIARLGAVRAAHPALRRGQRSTLGVTHDTLVYEMVEGSDRVVIAMNRGGGTYGADGLPPGTYRDLLTDEVVTAPLSLPPRSARVLVVEP